MQYCNLLVVADQFELLEKLGSGGMGVVYRARDTRLGRIVAVKVLSKVDTDENTRKRFFHEAQAASALNHPNIVTIHGIVSERGDDLIVMECVAGKTLAELIPKGGMRVPQILNYAIQITDALMVAHNAGIVHRDLKPGNIMVTDRGLVKVLDFGLAKMTEPLSNVDPDATRGIGPLTVEGSIIGTVAYMSPEQAEGKKVDARSDIFAMGAVLYEMATGRPAFAGGNALSILTSVLRDETRPIFEVAPDVPAELDGVIQRCLRKNPDDRYQSTAELHNVLLALKGVSDSGTLYRSLVTPPPQPVSSQATIRTSPAPPAKKSSKMGLIAGAVAVLILLGGAAFFFMPKPAKPTPQSAPVTPPTAAAPAPVPVTVNPIPQTTGDGVLRNDNILEMVKARVPVTLIISQIQSSKTEFKLSPNEVIRLVQGGVPEAVIEVMRKPSRGSQPMLPAPSMPLPVNPPSATATNNQATPPKPTAPPPAATPATAVATVTIPDGTPVRLSLSDNVPQEIEGGATLHFTVLADVSVGGAVVVKKGSEATGEIVDEAKKRKFLAGGHRATYILKTIESADGRRLRIRATPAGATGDAAKRPLRAVKDTPAGVIATKGTEYTAYIDGDVAVTPTR